MGEFVGGELCLISVPIYLQDLFFIAGAFLQTPHHQVGGRYEYTISYMRYEELKKQFLALHVEYVKKNKEFIRDYKVGDTVIIKPRYAHIQNLPKIGVVKLPYSLMYGDDYFIICTEEDDFTKKKFRYEFQGLQHPPNIVLSKREFRSLCAILDSVVWHKQKEFWAERGYEFPIYPDDVFCFKERVRGGYVG